MYPQPELGSYLFACADLRKTPSANVVIKYDRALTRRKLHGLEARELSARLHGVGAWWAELEKL